jgi:hypothetical protein
MKRSTLLSLSMFALAALACREVTGPFPFGRRTDLFPAGPLVVSAADMHGWAFADDTRGQGDCSGLACHRKANDCERMRAARCGTHVRSAAPECVSPNGCDP